MKMKNLIAGAVIVAGLCLTAPTQAATGCPAFIKQGESYKIGDAEVTILDIDTNSCWIKGRILLPPNPLSDRKQPKESVAWLNLNQVSGITPLGTKTGK